MIVQLAMRNIWRNRRRTLLTLSAMIVSSALLILALGVFSGMLRDMLATATEQYYGHLVINARDYQDNRDMYRFFSAERLPDFLNRSEAVRGYSPRLRSFGLLSHLQDSAPAELLGIVPQQETEVTGLEDALTDGDYLAADDRDGAVIGAGLARRLNLVPGDTLVFVTQAADGSIGNDLLQVRGIFSTGDVGHDTPWFWFRSHGCRRFWLCRGRSMKLPYGPISR